jgi:hypothetical protein
VIRTCCQTIEIIILDAHLLVVNNSIVSHRLETNRYQATIVGGEVFKAIPGYSKLEITRTVYFLTLI